MSTPDPKIPGHPEGLAHETRNREQDDDAEWLTADGEALNAGEEEEEEEDDDDDDDEE